MRPLGEPMTHVRLMGRMAKQAGVDLARAQEAGVLDQDDWAEMVADCRGCDWGDRCPEWLDTATRDAGAPGTCPNRDRFARLKSNLERLGHV